MSLPGVILRGRGGRILCRSGRTGQRNVARGCRPVDYNTLMPSQNASRRRQKNPPPGDTGQEALYLRFLSEKQVSVTVKLRDGETLHGWIEYFDDRMIRLTREGKPNLFIYKHQIRTISESGRRDDPRRRSGNRKNADGVDGAGR